MAETKKISAEEARLLVAGSEPVAVLDLRDQEEFGDGHVPGARNLPDASADSLPDDLPDEGKVLLCGEDHGVADALGERGLEVLVLDGGFDEWQSESLPQQPSADLEAEPGSTPKLPGAGV